MQFPNAAKGVSRIHTAEILALIAEIAVIIGAIVALVGAGAGSGGLAGCAATGKNKRLIVSGRNQHSPAEHMMLPQNTDQAFPVAE